MIPPEGLRFDRFVTKAGTWFAERPPFDLVLALGPDGERVFLPVEMLELDLRELGPLPNPGGR